ncbi:MAG: Flp pilus assembly complex ATPase component TadA, partial [Desulfovibrionaceae bacterium]|nr:Flp pilus assembly complex ATPase component TadA [Desulfovibrionaceae bacterium]
YAHDAARSFRGENAIQQFAIELLSKAYEAGASDIHLTDFGPYTLIQFRCLGMLNDHTHLEGDFGRQVIACIYQTLGQSGDACFSPSERQDGRICKREYLPAKVHSVRVHSEPLESALSISGVGISMALRLLYDSTSATGNLETRMGLLGFSKSHYETVDFLTRRTGLTIISGPTGHGKSTLLKHVMEAMVDRNPGKAFYSIEDPPEYPLKGVRQVIVYTKEQLERFSAYVDAIAGAMRADPDVLMIGEIRYGASAVAAIDAALTGHAVWATIHANNAFGIISRMISLLAKHFEKPLEHLCDHNVLSGLEYQRLVPVLCNECKIRMLDIPENEREYFIPLDVQQRLIRRAENIENVYVRGEGCERCNRRGLSSQTVAAEVVATDQAMLGFLRAGNTEKAYEHWKIEYNGVDYVQHALQLIQAGTVDPYLAEERLGVPLDFNHVLSGGHRK